MQFIGGGSQQEYVERTRGLDPSRCLAAGIDVGKYEALCLIADHRGEVVGEALTFPLTEPGVRALEAVLAVAARSRGSASLRIGVETAGHYHRTVVARLVAAGHDVVELNPAHVKAARAQQGSRRQNSRSYRLSRRVLHRGPLQGLQDVPHAHDLLVQASLPAAERPHRRCHFHRAAVKLERYRRSGPSLGLMPSRMREE